MHNPKPDENNGNIQLTVIVVPVGGVQPLSRCLEQLRRQVSGQPIEVIVPYDPSFEGVETLKQEFHFVKFVDMASIRTRAKNGSLAAELEKFDWRMAHGLRYACGDIIAILQDFGVPSIDWCQQVLEAHKLPYGVIGGAVEHRGRSAINWAVYFMDFSRFKLPLQESQTDKLTDTNISYKRATLDTVRELFVERFKETEVTTALVHNGVALWLRPQMVVYQDRGHLSLSGMLAERYTWGRMFGAQRAQAKTLSKRLFYILSGPVIPFFLIARIFVKVARDRQNRLHFLRSLPYLFILSYGWVFGEVVGGITRKETVTRDAV